MIKQDFNVSREKLLAECIKLTESKGADYTKGDVDVLINFKQGVNLGINPLQTCGLYMKKHFDAILNYIKTNGQSESEPIRERIKDNINYLLLLNALIEERDEIDKGMVKAPFFGTGTAGESTSLALT